MVYFFRRTLITGALFLSKPDTKKMKKVAKIFAYYEKSQYLCSVKQKQ